MNAAIRQPKNIKPLPMQSGEESIKWYFLSTASMQMMLDML